MIRKFFYLFMTAALLCGVACSSSDGGDGPNGNGDGPTGTIDEINGTKIIAGNSLVGLISDADTGKGIAGVPVTDGYAFTTTDANGVYQFKANRYCRNVYLTVPANYEIPLAPTTKLPLFYSTSTIDRNKVNRNDFTLKPLSAIEENFGCQAF